ncbi:MAG TPA: hypothetical protein VFU07_09160 [Candidatus Lumbricidophila sp.]|nr:hypothetical protein [Candidatus Lumbricidophila sp.]
MKKPFQIAVAIAGGLILAATAVGPANAANQKVGNSPDGSGANSRVATNAVGPVVTYYDVVNQTTTPNYINYSNRLTYCMAVTAGQTCQISQTFSVTRTIGVDLGYSREGVAAELSISSAATASVSVTCTSPVLGAGQRFEAYPIGTRYSYQIKKWGTMQPVTYSGWLTAFNPNGGIACRVS